MSKQLYPKPPEPTPRRKLKSKDNPFKHRYHVLYEDPDGGMDPEWKHYDSEAAVKADAFTKVRLIGFHTKATLYDHDEYNAMMLGPADD